MLLRYQCITPFMVGDVKPTDGLTPEESIERLNAYSKKRLIEIFKAAAAKYPFVTRGMYCVINNEDGEAERVEATSFFEFLNYSIKDVGICLDNPMCIINFFFYGSTPEELYEYLDAHDWGIDTDLIKLDIRNASLRVEGHTLPCTVTDLDAPVGFEHPLILDCINNRGNPFTLFSNRELLKLALTFSPSFHETVITTDYVKKAQQTIVNKKIIGQDDLDILETEYNFVKDGRNDFTWSNH